MPLPTQAKKPFSTPPSSAPKHEWRQDNHFPSSLTWQADSPHCVLSPIHYEPGYAYPLIVWLHSPVSSEKEVCHVMPLISVRNYVAVAPRGTYRVNQVSRGYDWCSSASHLDLASERVMESVEVARQRFHIHPGRIYVAGFGTGGTLALRMGIENPDVFAGAISLGGMVPTGHCLLRRINESRLLPLLLSVSPDQNYPLGRAMDDLRLLHSWGFSPTIRLYPEGDQLTTTMLSDVDRWIMQQVCPATSATAS